MDSVLILEAGIFFCAGIFLLHIYEKEAKINFNIVSHLIDIQGFFQ